MLLKAEHSLLLVVDVQKRLIPAIDDGQTVLDNTLWLTRLAQRLAVPVLATLQYPQGLGGLLPELAALLPAEALVEKRHFSAVADGCLEQLPDFARHQVVLTGIEAHVCVLQTALDLLARGKEVFVVAEAVGSRRSGDKTLALERLCQQGVQIVSREMVAFEWLYQAGTDLFRTVSREFIR